MKKRKAGDLKRQLLLAALECSKGDLNTTFTFEELLIKAWENDPIAWGLRGFERDHPDSERIHRELDSRGKKNKGLIDQGFIERSEPRVYTLSSKGLTAASQLEPGNDEMRELVDRTLEAEIHNILEHHTFKEWIKDPREPKRFRQAGRFWGVAPGTPPKVIKQRLGRIEATLEAAANVLDEKEVDEVRKRSGDLLFDRSDIERCLEFHSTLKQRFSSDLKILGVDLTA